MHVRVTTAKRGRKSYHSVQLVQSYRRPDGMPASRVLASFGNLPPLATENLKRAVAASREGQAVVLASQSTPRSAPSKVKRNLAYLDVAVCLRTWQQWELSQLIDQLAPATEREVSVGDVIAALTVQRCVAPASKLEASRWYPTTALPELQGVRPSQFNNTRVHRVLDMLDAIETPLQQQLARRIEAKQGQFVCLFLDCTDTWFVGHGPDLAHKRITKEGLLRRLIGIALMCDRRGFPLRWATVAGNHHEAKTMLDMIDTVSDLSWAEKLPLVVDRAMGRGVTVEALLAREVRFVTAIPAPEIASYSARIPLGAFNHIKLGESDRSDTRTLKKLHHAALELGFHQAGERYLFDLGVITKGEGGDEATASWVAPSCAVAALRIASSAKKEREAGVPLAELAQRYQCSNRTLRIWSELLGLSSRVQQRILQGEADRLKPGVLRRIARLPLRKQEAHFDRACKAAGQGPPLRANRKLANFCQLPPLQLRVVAVFNRTMFIEQRQAASRAERELQQLVEQTNEALRSPRSRSGREQAVGKVGHALRHKNMSDVFHVVAEETKAEGRTVCQLRLKRDDAAWKRRRATDGFSLIVSHQDVPGTADEIVALYFAKDKVEKDFQDIKSVLALRPVNHHTDSKVRAHVSLCMLALLIERAIEQTLDQEGLNMTFSSALHMLKTAHLNLYAGDEPLYSATEPDPDQRRILAALKLKDLADDDLLAETLTPR
jgi:hypothetical protein